MLILTRHIHDSIIIDENIKITVLKINRYQVCVGIVAPKSVPVHREEIYEKIQQEQENKAN